MRNLKTIFEYIEVSLQTGTKFSSGVACGACLFAKETGLITEEEYLELQEVAAGKKCFYKAKQKYAKEDVSAEKCVELGMKKVEYRLYRKGDVDFNVMTQCLYLGSRRITMCDIRQLECILMSEGWYD